MFVFQTVFHYFSLFFFWKTETLSRFNNLDCLFLFPKKHEVQFEQKLKGNFILNKHKQNKHKQNKHKQNTNKHRNNGKSSIKNKQK